MFKIIFEILIVFFCGFVVVNGLFNIDYNHLNSADTLLMLVAATLTLKAIK